MNLHGIVRGAINTVNPDRAVLYRSSTGYTTSPAGKRVPTYAADVTVQAQIQPLSARDLQHPEMLNVQGITRSVHLFGNVQGVDRIEGKGGDILLFSESLGGTVRKWLVQAVLEVWNPDVAGWCRVGVVLQTDG